MGCIHSFDVWPDEDHTQLHARLSAAECDVITDTWETICNTLDAPDVPTFERIFLANVDIQSVFRKAAPGHLAVNTSHPSTSHLSDVTRDLHLTQTHAVVVMETLGATVECLGDTEVLSRVLVSLGQIHATHDVRASHIACLWRGVRSVLLEILADTFTPEVDALWRTVYMFIASHMARGIRMGRTAMSENNSPIPPDTES